MGIGVGRGIQTCFFFHVQTKRARFYLTLLGLEWLGGFQVFHGVLCSKPAACLQIFLRRFWPKWNGPGPQLVAPQLKRTRADSRARAAPLPPLPQSTIPPFYHITLHLCLPLSTRAFWKKKTNKNEREHNLRLFVCLSFLFGWATNFRQAGQKGKWAGGRGQGG